MTEIAEFVAALNHTTGLLETVLEDRVAMGKFEVKLDTFHSDQKEMKVDQKEILSIVRGHEARTTAIEGKVAALESKHKESGMSYRAIAAASIKGILALTGVVFSVLYVSGH